jgi:hypothetical protein
MIYVGFLLFLFAGICEAIMDKLQFHYDSTIFKDYGNQLFWNPAISWKNKYKDGDPTNGEKFFLSKTLLVGFTDAWHMFKLFRTFFIFAGIYFLFIPCATKFTCLMFVIIARIIYGISFTIFFEVLED